MPREDLRLIAEVVKRFLDSELEVDDNNQVTGASIGLADAGSDLPPMPCLRRYAGNEKCGR